MSGSDVPVCLSHAREEMILALGSATPEGFELHRKLADEYLIKALHDIQNEPELEADWSLLRPHE